MQILLFSIIAGIVGTGLGGVIATLVKGNSDKTIAGFLSFAAGIMISIVAFGLVPEALEISNVYIVIFGIILGIVAIMYLNRLVDLITDKREEKLKLHNTHEELFHEEQVIQSKNTKAFLRSGIIMLVAIALHNIPEGLAIGASGIHDIKLGIVLTIMIALHNIPEGLAIAGPLIVGNVSKKKVILLTTLSGVPTLIGAIIGVLIGGISNITLAISLSLASGAMLYVVFGEVIPQSIVIRKDRFSTIITLLGIVIGLLLSKI